MADPTIGDRVWDLALKRALRKDEAVRPDQIAEDLGISSRKARDTLNVMSEYGWLDRDVTMTNEVRFLQPDDVAAKDWSEEYVVDED